MYKLKKKAKDFFFSISPCNIFLKDNRFGSDLFVYVFVHFAFIFFPYTYCTSPLVCRSGMCASDSRACPCNKWTYWLGDLCADKNRVIAPSLRLWPSPTLYPHYILSRDFTLSFPSLALQWPFLLLSATRGSFEHPSRCRSRLLLYTLFDQKAL